jgi:hypothetical protein
LGLTGADRSAQSSRARRGLSPSRGRLTLLRSCNPVGRARETLRWRGPPDATARSEQSRHMVTEPSLGSVVDRFAKGLPDPEEVGDRRSDPTFQWPDPVSKPDPNRKRPASGGGAPWCLVIIDGRQHNKPTPIVKLSEGNGLVTTGWTAVRRAFPRGKQPDLQKDTCGRRATCPPVQDPLCAQTGHSARRDGYA